MTKYLGREINSKRSIQLESQQAPKQVSPISSKSLNSSEGKRFSPKKSDESKRIKKISELTKLAQTLDPYKGPNKTEKNILKKYGITEYNDPFLLTNQVLLMLEDAIENNSTSPISLQASFDQKSYEG